MGDAGRFCGRIARAAIGCLFLSQAARAEIPPFAYARMQNAAGEVLQIEVLKVDGQIRFGADQESHLTVAAKVVCIVRSASGLTPGASITIGYSTVLERPRGWAGPAPIRVLKPGVYTAYLDKAEAIYAPAARGQSFIANKPGSRPSAAGKPC